MHKGHGWWRLYFKINWNRLIIRISFSLVFLFSNFFLDQKPENKKICIILNRWFLSISSNYNFNNVWRIDLVARVCYYLLCRMYCFGRTLYGDDSVTSSRGKSSFLWYLNSGTAELLYIYNTFTRWTNNSPDYAFVYFQLDLVHLEL